MGSREDSKNPVCEPLPYRFHVRKVENNLPELVVEPGEESPRLGPRKILTPVKPDVHKAPFEAEVEVLRCKSIEHIFKFLGAPSG
jgi:hypothetical protein